MKTNILRLVTECLWQDVDSRDDVYLVYKFIYDLELKKMGVDKKEFYDLFIGKNLTNPYTIRRIWNRQQELFPLLRGKCWEERQKNAGFIYKNSIPTKKELSVLDDILLNKRQLSLFNNL